MKLHKNKKGIGLVECIVALLLFTIVSGSVLSVFTAVHDNVTAQNEQYKLDILANNMLASFEGSKDFNSFSAALSELGLSMDVSDGGRIDETIGSGDTTGSYGFDVNDIPVAVPFSKIAVCNSDDGKKYATLMNSQGKNLVAFEGEYPNNQLSDDIDYGFKVSDLYNVNDKGPISKAVFN